MLAIGPIWTMRHAHAELMQTDCDRNVIRDDDEREPETLHKKVCL